MALNDGIEIRLYRADQKLKSGRWQAAWNEMARHPAVGCDKAVATKLWMSICIALRKWALGEMFGKLLVEQEPNEETNWLYYAMCARHSRGDQGCFDVYSEAVGLFPSNGSYTNARKLVDFWPGGSRRPGAMFDSSHRDGDIAIHLTTKVCKQRDVGITTTGWPDLCADLVGSMRGESHSRWRWRSSPATRDTRWTDRCSVIFGKLSLRSKERACNEAF